MSDPICWQQIEFFISNIYACFAHGLQSCFACYSAYLFLNEWHLFGVKFYFCLGFFSHTSQFARFARKWCYLHKSESVFHPSQYGNHLLYTFPHSHTHSHTHSFSWVISLEAPVCCRANVFFPLSLLWLLYSYFNFYLFSFPSECVHYYRTWLRRSAMVLSLELDPEVVKWEWTRSSLYEPAHTHIVEVLYSSLNQYMNTFIISH